MSGHSGMAQGRIYFDGGCKRGQCEICIVAVMPDHAVVTRGRVGPGNSQEAEWLALLGAAAAGAALGLEEVLLIGDSLGVIELANGWLRPRNAAASAFVNRYRAATTAFETVEIDKVRRDLNLAGRYLENNGGSTWFRSGLSLLEGVESFRPATNEITEKIWDHVRWHYSREPLKGDSVFRNHATSNAPVGELKPAHKPFS